MAFPLGHKFGNRFKKGNKECLLARKSLKVRLRTAVENIERKQPLPFTAEEVDAVRGVLVELAKSDTADSHLKALALRIIADKGIPLHPRTFNTLKIDKRKLKTLADVCKMSEEVMHAAQAGVISAEDAHGLSTLCSNHAALLEKKTLDEVKAMMSETQTTLEK